jgi:hypothetical protein
MFSNPWKQQTDSFKKSEAESKTRKPQKGTNNFFLSSVSLFIHDYRPQIKMMIKKQLDNRSDLLRKKGAIGKDFGFRLTLPKN